MPTRRLVESFRVLFDVKDASKTSNIETYLRALFNILKTAGMTLSDVFPFTFAPGKPGFDKYMPERDDILRKAMINAQNFHFMKRRVLEKNIDEVRYAYTNYNTWKSEIGSTVRRLNTIFQTSVSANLYGHTEGLDFRTLVADGWVVLVSASDEVMDDLESRLLATLIINNAIFAIETIRRQGFDKPYHLFIDETGEYATAQIAKVLNLKRKIRLHMVLAHQYLGQLKDPLVRDAVENNTKIKAAFYIEHQNERKSVIQMLGYGGQLEDRDVAYNLRDIPKQEMVLKIGKTDPVVCKVYDTPDAPNNPEFVNNITSGINYVSLEEIEKDYGKRFNGQNSIRPKGTAKSKHGTPGKTDGSQKGHPPKDAEKDEGKKAGRSKTSTRCEVAWDNLRVETDGGKDPKS